MTLAEIRETTEIKKRDTQSKTSKKQILVEFIILASHSNTTSFPTRLTTLHLSLKKRINPKNKERIKDKKKLNFIIIFEIKFF